MSPALLGSPLPASQVVFHVLVFSLYRATPSSVANSVSPLCSTMPRMGNSKFVHVLTRLRLLSYSSSFNSPHDTQVFPLEDS